MNGSYEERLNAVPRDMRDALAGSPSELIHGLSLAATILKRKAINGPPESNQESKVFANDFEEVIRLGKIQRLGDYFICSFSSSGDDLGQWRAYADNGHGYALGFDGDAPKKAFIAQPGAPVQKAFQITYDDRRLSDTHEKIIEKMFALISLPPGRNLCDDLIKRYRAELHTLVAVHTLHAGIHFKHEAYANEREYRFMRVHPPAEQPLVTKLRTRSYSSIRYQEFDWKNAGSSPLKEIVIGPAADVARAQAFAKQSLLLTRPASVDVVCSAIPYRPT